jgi:hypothetical protein
MNHILCFEKTADIIYGGLMLKRITIALIIGIFINISVSAAMVSFYVIETGLNEEANVQQSILWENAFMDVFFDAGFIISNAPLLRLEDRPANVMEVINMDEAIEGGVEYMLIVLLEYNKSILTPDEISLYVYRVSGRKLIIERKIEPGRLRLPQDEYENMKSIARGFIPYIGE